MEQSITHRNHYIPQFYLKNWSLDGKTIQTYSILVSNANVPYWTRQPIKGSAVWNDFYTRMEGDKEIDDFEHWFDREFEAPAKPILDKLMGDQKISHQESIVLSHYIFSQYVRTPAAYQRLTKQSMQVLPTIIEKTVQKLNLDIDAINFYFTEYYKENRILFDYKLRDGRCNTTNARYLLRMAGILK